MGVNGTACLHCGAALTGLYCASRGQKNVRTAAIGVVYSTCLLRLSVVLLRYALSSM